MHIGAGSGYYTAVLSQLLGDTGLVHAFEIENALASRAAATLRGVPGVVVHCENASDAPLPRADIIYANAGVTTVPDRWLDALNVGGRLLLPLTPNDGFGGMLMVERVAEDVFGAQVLGRVSFVPCAGHRSDAESAALAAAFEPHTFKAVQSFRRHEPPDGSAWYVGSSWWLSTTPVTVTH